MIGGVLTYYLIKLINKNYLIILKILNKLFTILVTVYLIQLILSNEQISLFRKVYFISK